jgi:hypothetical protein
MQGMHRQVSGLVADGRERAQKAICNEADFVVKTMYASELIEVRRKSLLHELWLRLKLRDVKRRYVEKTMKEKAPHDALY